MEIEIDFALVRRIVRQEAQLTLADLTAHGPLTACEQSQRRHDERLAGAGDAATLACTAGCSWCCHFTVDLRAVEVFRILDFIERHLSSADQQRVRREIEANRALLAPLDETGRMQRNVKCPFLQADRCTIYAARPQTCRNYHATDAAGCRKSFEEPDNLDIDPEFAPEVYQVGAAHVEGFSTAMRQAGYDMAAYEMNAALAVALEQPESSRRRFLSKLAPFPPLPGEEVPAEFSEEEEGEDEDG